MVSDHELMSRQLVRSVICSYIYGHDVRVVCKLLDLGHAVLGHAELGQRFWDMQNWDSFYSVKMGKIVVCVIVLFRVVRDEGVFVGATRTAVLGHAELGQRFWDMRNWDSGSGTCGSGTVFIV